VSFTLDAFAVTTLPIYLRLEPAVTLYPPWLGSTVLLTGPKTRVNNLESFFTVPTEHRRWFSMSFQDLGLIPGLSRPGKCDFKFQDSPGSVGTVSFINQWTK